LLVGELTSNVEMTKIDDLVLDIKWGVLYE
jgi:hypothetical protein